MSEMDIENNLLPGGARIQALVVPLVVWSLFAGCGFMLHADSQWQILAVLAYLVFILFLGEWSALGRAIAMLCRSRSRLTAAAAIVAAAVILLVFRLDDYTLLMLTTAMLLATACVGLNLQMAFTGVPNFAGAAFYAVGAYTAAVLVNMGVPGLLVIGAGGVMAALVGAVMILPVLRTRGHYSALVTIAFGVLLGTLLNVNDTFGGPQGMKVSGLSILGFQLNDLSEIGPYEVSSYLGYATAGCLLFGLAFFVVQRIEKSWAGIALDAVRTDEIAASVFGLSTTWWKAAAFLTGNFLIGMAGALYGMMNGFVSPTVASFSDSLIMISVIVLGGFGNLWGTLGASLIMTILPEKLQSIQEYRLLIFSLLVIVVFRFRPSGILPRPIRDLSGDADRRPKR